MASPKEDILREALEMLDEMKAQQVLDTLATLTAVIPPNFGHSRPFSIKGQNEIT